MAENTTLTDLRTQPSIMIGAFNNYWTARLDPGLRFEFRRIENDHIGGIVDRNASSLLRWSIDDRNSIGNISQDFGVITRKTSHLTGQPLLIVAGTGPYGTAAASDFITNPDYFEQFRAKAPRGWKKQDIQIVISTDVVGGRSGPPHMLTYDLR